MADVKWIKLTTTMFEDEKIDFIESLPESDSILIIWIKLLTLAGKCNMSGHIFLTESIPYNDEMLSHKFRRPLNTVRLALETFKKLSMIVVDDESFIQIANWEKHQNIVGMERIKEQTKARVQRHREQKKLLQGNEKSNVTVTQSNATELERELDKDIDKEIERDKEAEEWLDIVPNDIPPKKSETEYTNAYETFWAVYPRKKEKKKAFTVWKARIREGVTEELLIKCATNYAGMVQAEGTEERYIKHAATFLGPTKPYEEYIEPTSRRSYGRNKQSHQPPADEFDELSF